MAVMPVLADYDAGLQETMLVDRIRLRRKWREIADAERAGKPFDQKLAKWQADLDRARQLRSERAQRVPSITYDEMLPIHARHDEILSTIRDHQVVVICGETGSGKSTQLPKMCLELGRGIDGMIGHTQPRRIAARTIAGRVAEELHVPLGREVGYQVRFSDVTSPHTHIKLMTDGLLLAESSTDRWLNRYDTLIIDEAHERSLNIDFLLGYLHRLLPKRRDLKLIITSATIDAERFAEHFRSVAGTVPILTVSGRTYPVELVYPEIPEAGERAEEERELEVEVANIVEEACSRGPGDVLVFLPTERDIHEVMKRLKGRHLPGGKPDLLPLYARLPAAEQQRVFQTGSNRRIVLATNVAESSLTVPGIRYVIDTGTARISRYSPKSKLQRLPIESISQASADQRAGRCGRIDPGVCFRLYSREDYERRERYTPPEILRSNLASVVLQLEALGLGHIDQFPFLEPPKLEAVRDAYKTLFELGAVDDAHRTAISSREGEAPPEPQAAASALPHSGSAGASPSPGGEKPPRWVLTELGRTLHRMPVDPRIARIVVAGQKENCLDDILIIAAALELQDPRERPLDKQKNADEAHSRFADPDSDFLSYLRLWDFYHKLKGELTRSQLRKACVQNFLSPVRMQEWLDIHRELRELVRETDGGRRERQRSETQRVKVGKPRIPLPDGPCDPARSAAIHRALLTGFLSNIAYRTESGEYLAAGGLKAALWPGSGLAGKSPKWIVCGELLETTRRYLRTVGRIDPAWIEPLAGHLVTRTHTDPHWDPDTLCVMAHEKVSLFGLPVVPKRRVRYAKIDPHIARDLFVREGLVNGVWPDPPEFLAHNLKLAKRLHDLQTRSRQPAMLRDEEELIAFYNSRLPAEVVDGASLKRFLAGGVGVRESGSGGVKGAYPSSHPRTPAPPHSGTSSLFMTDADLLVPQAEVASPKLFPETLAIQQLRLPLAYQHEPGEDIDGVTVTVPHAGLNQLDSDRLRWLVPGLLEDKVTALLRSLPKDLRRDLVPLPDVAKAVTAKLHFAEGSLLAAISRAVEDETGIAIPVTAFQEENLPDHLRMRVEVVDTKGNTLGVSRDLDELRTQLGAKAAATFSAAPDPKWTRDGLKTWDFGPLPESVPIERAGLKLTGYPTLLDRGDSVSLRLYDSAVQAGYEFRFGLIRLFCLAVSRELKQQVDHLPFLNAWTLLGQTLPQPFPLRQHLAERIAERAFLSESPWPRSQADFGLRVAAGKPHIPAAAALVARQLQPLLETFTQIRRMWERTDLPQYQATRNDLHDHLSQLLASGFLIRTPWTWFVHMPRYLRGIVRRLEKLSSGSGPRDAQQLANLLPRWQRWKERAQMIRDRGQYDPELENYRWMIEEYRILLFAQELGAAISVSEKRLDKQWAIVTETQA
ncbi:MAG TPA: DUF3418 domain-containing protein [Planctomycetaceae bacterium]|nr:DUF3418 domain-containing protein [Planctomycetaceae bacterium]